MLQYTVNLWAHELKTRNLNTEHPDPAHFAQCDTSGYCVHRQWHYVKSASYQNSAVTVVTNKAAICPHNIDRLAFLMNLRGGTRVF